MGSVVLNGATSGSTTLQPTDATTQTITLPANSGTVITTASTGVVAPASLTTGAPSWDSSGNLSFNSGYGSTATAYGCRAWVNFNGTGTVAIRASGNVSSITDNGVGDYTVNFTAALVDANYSTAGLQIPTISAAERLKIASQTTAGVRVNNATCDAANTSQDTTLAAVSVFR